MAEPAHDPAADPASAPAHDAWARPATVYQEFERTPLWAALAGALADLTASSEVTVNTAPHYVIGFLCQELSAKRVVQEEALRTGT